MPLVRGTLALAADPADVLELFGADLTTEEDLERYRISLSTERGDTLLWLADPRSILLSSSFARARGIGPGEKVRLSTPRQITDFTVRGLLEVEGLARAFGGQIAVMDVFNAQFVFGRGNNFDRIDLMNEPETTVEELQRRLRERLPAGLEIERPSSRGQGLESAVKGMNIGMTVTSLIALLVGMFIIFNTFSISVNQRWKEIGVLRAIGVERKNVQRMFLGEAAVMGLIGSAIGIALGFGLSVGVEFVMSLIAEQLFGLASTRQAPVFRWDFALLSFALGVAASVVAAWAPARAASQLDPAMALHNIENRQRETVLGTTRLVGGVLMILAGLALGQNPNMLAELTAQILANGALMSYSREMESEADGYGVQELYDAGIDPNGLPTFFDKLRAMEEQAGGGGSSGIDKYFSSHPNTAERAANTRAMIAKLPAKSGLRQNSPEFQKIKLKFS